MPPKTIKYIPISSLCGGTKVETCYLLQNPQIRPKKDGSNFVTMELRDATGKITGIMWDGFDAIVAGTIRDNDYVEVTGDILVYNNQLQFKVSRIVKINDSAVDSSKFLPISPIPAEKLDEQFRSIIERLQDADLKRLVSAIFSNSEFMQRFRRAPGATTMHHAYIRGLYEHTISVVNNALKIAENYPEANQSILIAAALLHDIGKVVEYNYEKKITHSDVGRLLGHIAIGYGMVELECAHLADFPTAKKVILQHIMLSHHGMMEYGSPKRPKTLEALILHHADDLDAKIGNYLDFAAATQRNGIRWEFNKMFDRYMFSGGDNVEGADLMEQISRGFVTQDDAEDA
ncbi:MAG: HD domain-containing protein [bacterium]|nr:HD domain-containing protein [Candidatus Sumerlaeota bacterium]